LGSEAATFGEEAFVLCDPFVYETLHADVSAALEGDVTSQLVNVGGEASDEEVGRLQGEAAESDVVIGVGGGKTHDTAIIARAPGRFLVAGIGDVLSTRFDASACQ